MTTGTICWLLADQLLSAMDLGLVVLQWKMKSSSELERLGVNIGDVDTHQSPMIPKIFGLVNVKNDKH